jgi:hypothetical protein
LGILETATHSEIGIETSALMLFSLFLQKSPFKIKNKIQHQCLLLFGKKDEIVLVVVQWQKMLTG